MVSFVRYQNRNSDFHLAPEEVQRLILATDLPRNRLMLALFAFTGIRRAELRGLLGEDVSPEGREILIRSGKGKKQRLIFYPRTVDALMLQQLSQVGCGPLFPGRGGRPLSLRSINLIVAQVGRRAGVQNPNPRYKNVSPHLLRHSLARNWKRAGGSLESLQKILGHASLKTTMDVYGTESVSETKENYLGLAHCLAGSSSKAVVSLELH